MANSACEKIVKEKCDPPVMCKEEYCSKRQKNLDKTCHGMGYGAGSPIMCDEAGGVGLCYCCCSCFSFEAPVEVTPGLFERADTIEEGNQIMAAGLSLGWAPRTVTKATQIAASDPHAGIPGMYTVRYTLEGKERAVVLSPDDLLLVPTTPRTLKAVEHLRPGDALVAAGGGTATIVDAVGGAFAAGTVSIEMGEFDGTNLDGHLLNVYGVVAADFAVQAYYTTNKLPSALVSPPAPGQEAGAPVAHDEEWLSDPDLWPAGFTPFTRAALKPPAHARSFLTRQQAQDIRANADRTSIDNTLVALPLLYLFAISDAFYPKTTVLLDWHEDLPNAYAWEEWGRWIVLVTGGLMRVTSVNRPALSLLLADMFAYQEPGIECVGPADLFAASVVMRVMWSDSLYSTIMRPAIERISELFANVEPEHARAGRNVCKQPALDCRIETFAAGLTLDDLPTCAEPPLAATA